MSIWTRIALAALIGGVAGALRYYHNALHNTMDAVSENARVQNHNKDIMLHDIDRIIVVVNSNRERINIVGATMDIDLSLGDDVGVTAPLLSLVKTTPPEPEEVI